MRKFEIFIAGAKRLKEERLSMKALANDLNSKYSRMHKNVQVNMNSYENFGDDQSAYDEFIQKKADLVVFIFDGNIGKKTEEEFLLACKSLKTGKKPDVLVFLKSFSVRTDEINYLENLINENFDKYYVEYFNIEDLVAKAKERINGYVEDNTVINSKNIFQTLTRKWRKLVAGIAALVLLLGIFLTFLLSADKQLVYFNNTETPAGLQDAGISSDFVEQQIMDDMKVDSKDAWQKFCGIVDNQDTANDTRHAEPWAVDFGKIKKAKAGNVVYRKIRGLFGRHDIDVCVKIVETDMAIVGNVSIMKWDGSNLKKTIEQQKSDFDNKEQCTLELIHSCAAYIAGVYSPYVSVLYDYSSDVLDDYQIKNPWKDGLYTETERESILLDYGQQEQADAPFAYLLLGNYYENVYMEKMSKVAAETSLQYYQKYLELDNTYKECVESKMEMMNALQEESQPAVSNMADKIVPVGDDCCQLIVVTNEHKLVKNNTTFYKGDLYTFEKQDGEWKEKFPKTEVNLSKYGLVSPSEKREGDYMTPEGYYSITNVFGYKKDIETKMPFVEVTKNHVWVSDTLSPDYNKMVVDQDGKYQSNGVNERLYRNDFLYKYVIVIDYNMNPIVKGKGSALFMHIERRKDSYTAGCVSMPEEDIVRIIKWLSPECKPHVFLQKEITSY